MDCIFCKIVAGEIPSKIVFEDDKVIAFNDISPAAPVHILIIPKKHINSALTLSDDDYDVISSIFKTAVRLAKEFNIAEDGFRIVNNCGKNGGQTVEHLHFHLIGGRCLTWPPG
ncbi:MAG: histidine triad nucleotide-binding protein [Clostridiaceae bacterium]|jgi:histidine triad (HIT) family protein|nr:histidine triad nucleotide-binding protein [Clostridiaceae bacterium]